MRSEVTVTFPGTAPVRIELEKLPAMPRDDARRWLDEQFTQMGCEPLRPTGKLLTADKVVVVAESAGPSKFADDSWAQTFALAAAATLGKPMVHIDVASLSVSY